MTKSPQSAARILAKSQASNKPWFTIKNSADGSTADVMIYDEIGMWGVTAADFVQELQGLDASTINVHLNSPGGDCFDGLAIYNTLKQSKATINMFIEGLAASAASFIACAGDNVSISRNAMMMIHDAAGFVYGNASEMQDMADLLNKTSDNVADIYATKAGGTVADWRATMQQETWYSSAEAVSAGLCDDVLNEDGDSEVENKFKNQLSVFNYAGRKNAPSPFSKQVLNNKSKENSVTDAPGNEPKNDKGSEPGTPVTPPTPVVPVVDNKQHSHVFNLKSGAETDFGKVQAYITNLETSNDAHQQFQNETKDAARKAYITQLAADNKILATQVEPLTAHALTLSDEQYASFQTVQNMSTSNALLAPHGQPNGTGSAALTPGGTTAESAQADRKNVLQQIVDRHKMNNMPKATLEASPSWIELQQILAAEAKS